MSVGGLCEPGWLYPSGASEVSGPCESEWYGICCMSRRVQHVQAWRLPGCLEGRLVSCPLTVTRLFSCTHPSHPPYFLISVIQYLPTNQPTNLRRTHMHRTPNCPPVPAVAMLFDASSGARVADLTGHSDYSFAAAWHPDGNVVATGSQVHGSLVYSSP